MLMSIRIGSGRGGNMPFEPIDPVALSTVLIISVRNLAIASLVCHQKPKCVVTVMHKTSPPISASTVWSDP